jgi:hypothetical protein
VLSVPLEDKAVLNGAQSVPEAEIRSA